MAIPEPQASALSSNAELEPDGADYGFVLHRRPYREHSSLLELWTLHCGRVSVLTRSSAKKYTAQRATLQPFIPLELRLKKGAHGLWYLQECKRRGPGFELGVPVLFSAVYLNELIYYLVRTAEPDPELFAAYLNALNSLAAGQNESAILRRFEALLLASLGYALRYECADGTPLQSSGLYRFIAQRGFELIPTWRLEEDPTLSGYTGEMLLSLKNGGNGDTAAQQVLKELHRCVIDRLLGGRALKSRELYLQYQRL
ncbi:MAG: DNA repair protein RecO [Succinivibrio sp.]|nr:DNA repair protein RecO [Succinivibrio sp.]